MIAISKSEKETIIKQYPSAHIVRTVKQHSKRHHYYMVEQPGPMKLLMKLRGEKYTPSGRGERAY